MATNLTGSVDLLKLQRVGIATIKGKKCVIIPLEFNDIYVSSDDTGKAKSAYLSLNINERKEPSQYGKTHYCKAGISKSFKESHDEALIKAINDTYLGDFKPYVFEAQNQAEVVSAPSLDVEEVDDLPF